MSRPDYKKPGQARTAARVAAKSAGWDPARVFDEQFTDALDRDEPTCICRCGERVVHLHHVVYAQHLEPEQRLDARNLVPVAFGCHGAHHNRSRPYELRRLPDSVFVFASEVMGPGAAYEYLPSHYAGEDARLDALLGERAA